MLAAAALLFTKLVLPLFKGYVLQEVCFAFALGTFKAQLAEEGHDLQDSVDVTHET